MDHSYCQKDWTRSASTASPVTEEEGCLLFDLSEPLRHHFVLAPRKHWVEKPPDNREHPIRDVRAYRLLFLTKQGFLTYNFIHVPICSYSVSSER